MKLLVLKELGHPQRMWDEVVPLLQDRGVDLVVGSVFAAEGLQDQVTKLGAGAVCLDCTSAADYPRVAVELARWLRRERIDVVHGTEPIAACIGGLAGHLAKCALRVFHRQHLSFDSHKLTWLSRAAAHVNDVVLACSTAAACCSIQLDKVRPAHIMIAYNGSNRLRSVPLTELQQIREALSIAADEAVVSVVARLERVKGLDILIKAIPRVQDELGKRVHVVIAGEGRQRQALIQEAQYLGLSEIVHLVGHQSDIALWFSLGDVVAMPSRREAFGVAAAEAMACGRPIVASAVGGLCEVIANGETGLVVPPEDPVALASGLVDVLAHAHRAQAMGDAGQRRFLERFTNERMVDSWLDCYRSTTRAR